MFLYSGIIHQATRVPIGLFPVLFAIAHTAGWMAQRLEMLQDEEKIARPRQMDLGPSARDYVAIDRRPRDPE